MKFCEVCGAYDAHTHHIRTRGAGGDDDELNLMRLCFEHHTEIHKMGARMFGNKYGFEERIKKALERGRYEYKHVYNHR